MRSSWLSTASAVFVCAAAVANSYTLPPKAEELRFDQAGNLVWQEDAVADSVPSLGRPDFSALDVVDKHASSAASKAKQSVEAMISDAMRDVESAVSWAEHEIDSIEHAIDNVIHGAEEQAESWLRTGRVMVEGLEYERLVHPHFPEYALRLSTTGKPFCDQDVVQHSGYLDISGSKHLWFIFFESRSKPKEDPVVLWLNGGPGCSSSTGLLFELGPCRVANEGKNTEHNPHSWNNHANLLFLDQPVDVGYSYSDDDSVNNSPAAAEDVYAFLQLFFKKFPEYANLPFTASGESYAGTYLPNIASTIHKKNKQLSLARYRDADAAPMHINLESVAIGNGLSAPQIQFPTWPDFVCGEDNEFRLFEPESSTCTSIRQKAATCKSLVESCQKYNSRLTCTPAALYCWSMYSPAQSTGRNLYDTRRKCDRAEDKDGPLCYREMSWIETLMNRDDVKANLGIAKKHTFTSCNMDINKNFLLQGDSMHDSSALLPELIEDGIRLLIYAGETDSMCPWNGNFLWVKALETSFKAEFNNATSTEWKVGGKRAGLVTKAGKGAGSVAFLKAYNAGHMFPADAPEAAAEMIEKWIRNEAFV
ncbi:uncharacterized protein PFL1_00316 [Pseudozyma flocculosa PF-1]|uniref:Related to carboxypeptidase n=1 Tax=Pseudozyma flocculosa TaxID=84751 RepID=A0A5C3ETT4_9BASI|nr:uncharacterized protein PFL1_00316 [Pseudozyma flocculosa PF-1]EPQ32119.1 hypothetical protein PFL1_00316 [Pseudozyma flocculosa PF-1]SPO34946.1 related to carboxypeptidase [Pseudozyma flocculosa]